MSYIKLGFKEIEDDPNDTEVYYFDRKDGKILVDRVYNDLGKNFKIALIIGIIGLIILMFAEPLLKPLILRIGPIYLLILSYAVGGLITMLAMSQTEKRLVNKSIIISKAELKDILPRENVVKRAKIAKRLLYGIIFTIFVLDQCSIRGLICCSFIAGYLYVVFTYDNPMLSVEQYDKLMQEISLSE